MPIYEYQCSKCMEKLEIIQPMNAKSETACGERCVAEGKPGDGELRRLHSVMAIHSGASSRSDAELPEAPACGGCGKEGTPSCPLGM